MKALWNRTTVFATAGLASLLAGCGGSGGGTSGGGTVIAAVVPSKITVTLPAGYKPSGALTVSGGLFGSAPLTSGQASIKSWNTGSELVAVLDSSGNPVLLGWIGDGNTTISARTTADALTYFAIEGFGAPNENQAALITAISQQGGGTTVANDITADLASGKNLGSSGVAFAPDLKSFALSLVGGSAPAVVHALAPVSNASNPVEKPASIASISPDPTTPAGTQSGVTITAGTAIDTLVATNNFRRRVLLFIDRADTFDSSTPPVKNLSAAIAISENPIAPAVGGVNGGSVSGNLTGSIGAVSSGPYSLLAVPTNQFGADYDITAVGPGTSNSPPAYLTPSEITDAQAFLQRTFFTDFFLPVMNRICISNTLTQVQSNSSTATTIANAMDKAADAQSAGVDAFITTNFANAQTQMSAGDFLGANASVLATINGDPKTFAAVVQYYSTFLQSVGNGFTPSNSNINAVALWMATALKNVDVSNLPTALPQYQGITESQVYSTWTVTQTTVEPVSLVALPANITTTVGSDISALTATVNFGTAGQPANTTVIYSWTTPGAHGDLVFPDNTKGTISELNSTFNTSQYFANLVNQNNVGSDVVTVTVSLKKADGTSTVFGSATATITVGNSRSGYGTPLYYFMGSASGSPVTIAGGTFTVIDTTNGTTIWPDANNTGSVPVVTSTFGGTTGGVTLLVLGIPPKVQSGDTITVYFDCPVEDFGVNSNPPTSIGTNQDIHLFAPNTGQDLGALIPQFTSNVGDTNTGSYQFAGGGAPWIVTKTFKIP